MLNHAHQGDALTEASLALSVTVFALVWRLLKPGRVSGGATLAASSVLSLCAVAVVFLAAYTLDDALRPVWGQHILWHG